MKLHKLMMMALISGGIAFAVTGCGKNAGEKSETKVEEKKSEYRIVTEEALKEKIGAEYLEFLKFEKEIKVNDNYVMVCCITKDDIGEKTTFHLKKIDGKWKVVDATKGWEPIDRFR